MARDTAQTPTIPRLRLLQDAASYSSDFAAPSLSAPFKLDEGYSDETKSQPDKEFLNPSPDDVMPLPDWVHTYGEAERAGAFNPPFPDPRPAQGSSCAQLPDAIVQLAD